MTGDWSWLWWMCPNKGFFKHIVDRITLIGRLIKKLRCAVVALLINWPRGVRCPSWYNRGGWRGRAVPSVKVQRGVRGDPGTPSGTEQSVGGGLVGVEKECCRMGGGRGYRDRWRWLSMETHECLHLPWRFSQNTQCAPRTHAPPQRGRVRVTRHAARLDCNRWIHAQTHSPRVSAVLAGSWLVWPGSQTRQAYGPGSLGEVKDSVLATEEQKPSQFPEFSAYTGFITAHGAVFLKYTVKYLLFLHLSSTCSG